MTFTQIKETCVYTADLESARQFYNGVLELPVQGYVPGKHVFFRVGSSMLLCFNPGDSRGKTHPPAHHAAGKYHFALEVKPGDYESCKKRLLERGIRITDSMVWDSGQESFYFEDPFGNVLEVVPAGIWD